MIVRELVARFGFQTDTSGLDRADKRITTTKDRVDGLGKALGGAFAALGAYGVAGKVNEAVDASNRFGEAMGKIQSLIPGNTTRTREYRKAIEDLALSTGQTLDDVAAGAYDVISTFGDTADAIDQISIAVKTGAAGAATTKDGLALLGAVTKAYGDTSAVTMQKVADLGFQTVNLGKVELPELAASIGQATPLAANLGVTMEELFAVMASASGVTGTGSEVMTQMSSAMQALVKQTPDMKKAWKRVFGKDSVKEAIARDGVVGVFQKLTGSTDGSIEQVDKLFGRIEGLKLILQLTQKGAGDFADKMKSMKNVAGATDTAFAAMTGGMAANATQAKKTEVAFAALQVAVGDELSKPMNEAKAAALEFATVLGDDLLPLIQTWNGEQMQTQGLDDVRMAAHATSVVLLGLAEAADTAFTAVNAVGNMAKGAVQEIDRLGVLDFSGMARVFRERNVETAQIWQDWAKRSAKRGAMVGDPEYARSQVELARTRDEVESERQQYRQKNRDFFRTIAASGLRGAIAGGQVEVRDNSFNFTLPPGTPVQQAEVLGEQIADVLGRELNKARRAIPNRTDKSGVEGFGGAGTNSTMQQDAWATGTGL